MIWIEPTASYSNASRPSGIGRGRPVAIGKVDSAATKAGRGQDSNPDFITVASSAQGTKIGRQGVDVGIVQFLPERRHLAFDARGDDLMNSRVTLVQIVEVGTFVAERVITVAVRAVQKKEISALAHIGNEHLGGRRGRELRGSNGRRQAERGKQRGAGGHHGNQKRPPFAHCLNCER